MPNTYTQLHVHFVFAVKFRKALIKNEWKDDFHSYITGICQNNQHKMIQINSMPDHLHMLIGLRPHQSISSLIQNVKSESSRWLKNEHISDLFSWQEGFGAFAYSKKDLPNVIGYIKNQEEHHKKTNFLNEYTSMLIEHGIEYEAKYIFRDLENNW
jgi:REP element-mobilizing transposase RayT